jgi:hypothetical protein
MLLPAMADPGELGEAVEFRIGVARDGGADEGEGLEILEAGELLHARVGQLAVVREAQGLEVRQPGDGGHPVVVELRGDDVQRFERRDVAEVLEERRVIRVFRPVIVRPRSGNGEIDESQALAVRGLFDLSFRAFDDRVTASTWGSGREGRARGEPQDEEGQKRCSHHLKRVLTRVRKLFFFRQGIHFPPRGEEADDALGAIAFEHHAALHLDLHAAASGFEGHRPDVENVAAFPVVERIIRHEAFPGHGDAAFGSFRVILRAGERPALRLFVDAPQFLEQLGIDSAEEGDGDDLLRVVHGGDPAGQPPLADVVADGVRADGPSPGRGRVRRSTRR